MPSTTKGALMLRMPPSERAEIKAFWHRMGYRSETEAARAAIKAGMVAIEKDKT